MGRLGSRILSLERETSADAITVKHPDGSASRFHQDAVMECFVHEMGRMRRHHDGDEPEPAHPFIVALRTATNLEALMAEHGTMVGHLLGEDEIMRGVRERTGLSAAGLGGDPTG